MLTKTKTSKANDNLPSKQISKTSPTGINCASSIKRRFLVGLIALSCLALLAFGAKSMVALSKEAAENKLPRQPLLILDQATESIISYQDEPSERMEFVVITVTPFGFEPQEIERSRNAFVLAVHNHSGIADLSLRLHRVNNEKLHEIQMRRGRGRWQLPLNLPAGDYLLTAESQPEWRCKIRLAN